MKSISKWLSKPFPIWENSTTRKLLVILLIEIFSVGFKFLYKPFEMNIQPEFAFAFFGGHALINVIILLFQYFILPVISFGYFADQTRTNFREVLWILLLFLLLTLAHASYVVDDKVYLVVPNKLFDSLFVNLAIGVFPIAFILTMSNLKHLRDKLKEGDLWRATHSDTEIQNELISLSSDSGGELIKVSLSDLLYIKSSDNYSEIFYKEEAEVKKKVIRASLSNIEDSVELPYLFRTHRSYIVNFLNIDAVRGNANKCEVILKHTEFKVPVSRSKRSEMLDKLSSLPVSYSL